MLRRGFEAPTDPPEKEHPLFGPEAQGKLRAIEVSDLWLALRAGIEAQREALFSTPLRREAGETMKMRWGAIQQLSLLLHGGPQMILQYTQLAASVPPEETEREYVANPHVFDGK